MPVTALLERPEGLEPFDVALVREGGYPVYEPPKARMPDRPMVPSLARPASGGEALELADLALARGDAFDASAQYRALLPELDDAAAAYVTLQLARAYRALGDRERATSLLERATHGSGAPAWVALVELAEVRAYERGGLVAARDLAPRAGIRAELVVDHLIHTQPADEAAVMLLDKAARLGRCEFAAQAFVLDPDISPSRARPCVSEMEAAQYASQRRERNERHVEYYDRLGPFVERWDELAAAVRGGNRDPEPWLVFVEDISSLASHGRLTNHVADLSHIMQSALIIATELALARDPADDRTVRRIRSLSERTGPDDRTRVRRHVESLQRAYGAR